MSGGATLTPYTTLDHDHEEAAHNELATSRRDGGLPQPVEISARQKMLAACSGSLLTSLLGTFLSCDKTIYV